MRATINGLRMAIVALACYWVLLFIGTHIPADRIFVPLNLSDKVLHFIAFAGLSFLIAWAVPTNDAKLHQNIRLAALISVVYAGLDELLQIPVGRTADWMDFFADCFGVPVRRLANSRTTNAHGAALLALVERGDVAVTDVPKMLTTEQSHEPDPSAVPIMHRMLESFVDFHRRAAPFYDALNSPEKRRP